MWFDTKINSEIAWNLKILSVAIRHVYCKYEITKKAQTHPTNSNRQTLIGLECNFRKIYIRVCIKSIKFISLFSDKRTDIYFTNTHLQTSQTHIVTTF